MAQICPIVSRPRYFFSVALGVGCYNMPSKSVDDDNWCTWEDVTTETVCISPSEGLVTRNFVTLKCEAQAFKIFLQIFGVKTPYE